jgi:DNA repair photolyase
MPRCGSQIVLCDYPVRFDTYSGCSHACEYCFTRRKLDDKIGVEAEISGSEGPKALRSFIEGKRTAETNWCDWDIPLHIGGLSDPFQPYEAKKGTTLECLKILAETKYPFIISTKGDVPKLGQQYIDLLSACNVCFQISLVSPEYDKLEQGAPNFERRLEILSIISPKVPRTIIRIQPYMITELENVLTKTLPGAKKSGVYGVTIEGMKFFKDKPKGTISSGGDFVYPTETLLNHFNQIKEKCHELGMKFYCGENRLRWMGDSLSCCGCDGLEGFKPNNFNLNHIFAGENPDVAGAMCQGGTACCFKTLNQSSWCNQIIKQPKVTFKTMMEETAKSKFAHTIMGLDTVKNKKRLF